MGCKYLTLDNAQEYLPVDIFSRADIKFLLDRAERDTILAYRRGPIMDGDYIEQDDELDEITGDVLDPNTLIGVVQLRFYEEDPALVSKSFNGQLFIDSMRAEIANTLIHQATRDEQPLPDDFGGRLKIFELSPVFNLVG
jgi:hypothetical protein